MEAIRRLTAGDLPRLRQFWIEHWSGEEIIAHGQVIRPGLEKMAFLSATKSNSSYY